MQIFIRTLQGKSIPLEFDGTDTISAIKARIFEKEGVPVDQQRLVFSGKQLEDANTLESYNIESGSQIHMILRLKGG